MMPLVLIAVLIGAPQPSDLRLPLDDDAPAIFQPPTTTRTAVDEWRRDPFAFLGRDMTDVVGRLSRQDTSPRTQERQEAILSRLDELIEALEKACSSSRGSGGGSNPTSPAASGAMPQGGPDAGPLRDPAHGRRQWGELPPHERQRILQSRTEGFPAGYEDVLDEYFQRLAQEEMFEPDAPAEQPSHAPAQEAAP